MHTITIRIEDEMFNEIEMMRGTQSKSEFYRKILEDHLNSAEDGINTDEYNLLNNEYKSLKSEYDALNTKLQHCKEVTQVHVDRVVDLQNQLGFMQLEFQKISGRLLLSAPTEKKWWQIWK